MMLDYSYWALCSAGIITIISYSTGREKYKTATAQESDQHRKEKDGRVPHNAYFVGKKTNHEETIQTQNVECPARQRIES